MLLKDGEPFELNAGDKEKLRNMFPGFYDDKKRESVTLDYDPSRIRKRKDGREIKPPMMGLGIEADVMIDGAISKITWCTSRRKDPRTEEMITKPRIIEMSDRHMLNYGRDNDLLAFLALYSKQVGNNMADQAQKSGMPSFNFYLPKKIASDRFKSIKEQARAKALVLDEERVNNEDVVEVAKAMYLMGVDNLSPDEIRVMLHDVTLADVAKCKDFLNIVDNATLLAARAMIIKAQEKKVLYYDHSNFTWYRMDDEGNKGSMLVRVKRGDNAEMALQNWFGKHVQEYENIKIDTDAMLSEDDILAREKRAELQEKRNEVREKELRAKEEENRLKQKTIEIQKKQLDLKEGEVLTIKDEVILLGSSLNYTEERKGQMDYGRHKNQVRWTLEDIEAFFKGETREYYLGKKQDLIKSLA